MDPKPGINTTEFWTSLIGTLTLAAPALFAALGNKPWVAAILGAAATVVPAVYIWGRSILKAELAKQTNIIPDKWEGTLGKALDVVEALAGALPALVAATQPATASAGATASTGAATAATSADTGAASTPSAAATPQPSTPTGAPNV